MLAFAYRWAGGLEGGGAGARSWAACCRAGDLAFATSTFIWLCVLVVAVGCPFVFLGCAFAV
jgi:hypothetical protein